MVQESKTGSAKFNPKTEARNPKSRKAGRIKKIESAIGQSASAFGLLSAFGFRDSGFSRHAAFLTPVWLAKKSAASFSFTWRRV
jgi:hypothetical protein